MGINLQSQSYSELGLLLNSLTSRHGNEYWYLAEQINIQGSIFAQQIVWDILT